jgi:hypothetical protein
LFERPDARWCRRVIFRQAHQHSDTSRSLILLRVRGQWPSYSRAAEKRDEIASFHRITSRQASRSQNRR